MNEHSLIYMTNLYEEAMDLNTKLQEELENLKNTNEEHRVLNGKLREENKRLNNIINDLEKELFIKKEFYERELTKRPKNDSEYNTRYADNCALAQICVIYDKLQELKGEDKE